MPKKKNTEEFINGAIEVHGDIYMIILRLSMKNQENQLLLYVKHMVNLNNLLIHI